jgi:hypothetical protein
MLTRDNYFTETGHLSNSQFKCFERCEDMALAESQGLYRRAKTTAQLVGSYVDAHVEGKLEEFIEKHPGEIISSRGATKGQPKAEFRAADIMINRFERDPFFMSFLEGEKQQIYEGVIGGVEFKAMADIVADDKTVDLKTVANFDEMWLDGQKVSFIRYWGYDIQGAIYQELRRQTDGEKLPFYLACVTKEPVPDIAVIQISDDILAERLKEIEYAAGRYQAIKMGLVDPVRCERCDWCKATKELKEVELYE